MNEAVTIRGTTSKWPKVHVAQSDIVAGFYVRFFCGMTAPAENIAVVDGRANCKRCLIVTGAKGGRRG